jgi:hypothetical protein
MPAPPRRGSGWIRVVLVLLVLVLAGASAASGMVMSDGAAATISSDLPDYNPGQTVTLTGGGWDAGGAPVHIVVNDDSSQTWQHVADVTPSADGTVTDRFDLPSYFVAAYSVVATQDTSSGTITASTSFTDANPSADLDQCANDPAPSPSTDGCSASASDWVNGNLGASKALYFEGDSIPYRMRFDNLAAGSHTVTIEWDTTKGGKHALDYLTTFNRTVATANPLLGVGALTSTTFPIPNDPQVTGAGVTPASGNFTMYGATITAASAYSYLDGTGFSGDKSARITLTFTAAAANPVLAWGGHISSRADWGANNSAVAIPGSPYHTRLIALDGGGGNQDRSLSADAVIFPGSLTVVKQATPETSTSFGAADQLLAGRRRHGGQHEVLRQHHGLPDLHGQRVDDPGDVGLRLRVLRRHDPQRRQLHDQHDDRDREPQGGRELDLHVPQQHPGRHARTQEARQQ